VLVTGCELRVTGCELRVVLVTGCGLKERQIQMMKMQNCGGPSGEVSTSSLRQAQDKQYRQAQDKFFVFRLTIATILYKYMYICLWTALRIEVFERGICGFCTEI